MAGPIGRAV